MNNLMSFIEFGEYGFEIFGLEIRWYAVFILTGAIIAFLLSKFFIKKGGYNPELADTVFCLAFPAGILGARIWWCIADEGSPWHNGDFWGFVTKFRDGGLAIMGGVIAGAAVGIWIIKKRYKETPLLFVLDCATPNILIAQALGRWGNFVNIEVYGQCVPKEKLAFLPNFIVDRMSRACSEVGMAAQPLFLYESLLNICGFVLITFILRKFWKKGEGIFNRHTGDLAALYFLWYGTVRLILEPLRNEEFIMGALGKIPASILTSILFIIIGVVFLVLLRVIKPKKVENKKNA